MSRTRKKSQNSATDHIRFEESTFWALVTQPSTFLDFFQNPQARLYQEYDKDGLTALHKAAMSGAVDEFQKRLVQSAPDVTPFFSYDHAGRSPLTYACAVNQKKIIGIYVTHKLLPLTKTQPLSVDEQLILAAYYRGICHWHFRQREIDVSRAQFKKCEKFYLQALESIDGAQNEFQQTIKKYLAMSYYEYSALRYVILVITNNGDNTKLREIIADVDEIIFGLVPAWHLFKGLNDEVMIKECSKKLIECYNLHAVFYSFLARNEVDNAALKEKSLLYMRKVIELIDMCDLPPLKKKYYRDNFRKLQVICAPIATEMKLTDVIDIDDKYFDAENQAVHSKPTSKKKQDNNHAPKATNLVPPKISSDALTATSAFVENVDAIDSTNIQTNNQASKLEIIDSANVTPASNIITADQVSQVDSQLQKTQLISDISLPASVQSDALQNTTAASLVMDSTIQPDGELRSEILKVQQDEILAKHQNPQASGSRSAIFQSIEIPPAVLTIMSTLVAQGYHARIYGGAVSDTLLGIVPSDYDIRTNAPIDACRALGLFQCKYKPNLFQFNKDIKIDIFCVKTSELHQCFDDALSLLSADLHGAVSDDSNMGLLSIQRKEIILLAQPELLFATDPITMLRVARKAAKYDFRIPESLREAIHKHAPILASCSRDQIRTMCQKCVTGGKAEAHLRQWFDLGLLPVIFPSRIGFVLKAGSLDYHWFFHKLRQLDLQKEQRCSPFLFVILLISSFEIQDSASQGGAYFLVELNKLFAMHGFRIYAEKWMEKILLTLITEKKAFTLENYHQFVVHHPLQVIDHYFEAKTGLSAAIVENHFNTQRLFAPALNAHKPNGPQILADADRSTKQQT